MPGHYVGWGWYCQEAMQYFCSTCPPLPSSTAVWFPTAAHHPLVLRPQGIFLIYKRRIIRLTYLKSCSRIKWDMYVCKVPRLRLAAFHKQTLLFSLGESSVRSSSDLVNKTVLSPWCRRFNMGRHAQKRKPYSLCNISPPYSGVWTGNYQVCMFIKRK